MYVYDGNYVGKFDECAMGTLPWWSIKSSEDATNAVLKLTPQANSTWHFSKYIYMCICLFKCIVTRSEAK